jgi:hypothetical protein
MDVSLLLGCADACRVRWPVPNQRDGKVAFLGWSVTKQKWAKWAKRASWALRHQRFVSLSGRGWPRLWAFARCFSPTVQRPRHALA